MIIRILICAIIFMAMFLCYLWGKKDGEEDTWEYIGEQVDRPVRKFDFKCPDVLTKLNHSEPCFTVNEYQRRAKRTINENLTPEQMALHAMFGLMSEVGEMASLYQKVYQGHELDENHLFSELGDAMWFESELATAYNRLLGSVTEQNIEKLEKRYKTKFTEEESKHRAEGDI